MRYGCWVWEDLAQARLWRGHGKCHVMSWGNGAGSNVLRARKRSSERIAMALISSTETVAVSLQDTCRRGELQLP